MPRSLNLVILTRRDPPFPLVTMRTRVLAVDRGEDPKAHLLGMSGGAVHMRDYLVEQVLYHQAPELQKCLLRISILDRHSRCQQRRILYGLVRSRGAERT